MALFESKTVASMTKGIGDTAKALGRTVSAAAVFGEGLAARAEHYNQRMELEQQYATDLHAKTAAKEYSANLLSKLNAINQDMLDAKRQAVTLVAAEHSLKHFANQVEALTPEQHQDIMRKGIDLTDPVALQKYLLGSTAVETIEAPVKDEQLSEIEQLLQM